MATEHGEQKGIRIEYWRQAHALVYFGGTPEKGVDHEAADGEEADDHERSEEPLPQFEVIPTRSGKSR